MKMETQRMIVIVHLMGGLEENIRNYGFARKTSCSVIAFSPKINNNHVANRVSLAGKYGSLWRAASNTLERWRQVPRRGVRVLLPNADADKNLSDGGFSDLDLADKCAELVHGDPYLSETEKDIKLENANSTPLLLRAILNSNYNGLTALLDKWVKGGNPMSQEDVVTTMVQLRRRRMFKRALKVSDWLDVKKPFELNENDCAARLDLIAKVNGLFQAEKFLESLPAELRGQKVYRTLLANCSSSNDIRKTEEVFRKMKDTGLALSTFVYNQLLLLYKRHDRKKIAEVLQMMQKDNVKPASFTYRILLDAKGRVGDIDGMEEVLQDMRAEGIEPELGTLELLAKHYISAGFSEKADAILKDMEEESITNRRRAIKMLLPLYADIGKTDEVERIWRMFESFPNLLLDEYVSGIVAWGKLGQVERAEAIFENMLNSGKKISAKHFNALLGVYVNHKLLQKGKDLVKQMSDKGCKIDPTTWDALVRIYVELGELEKADSILLKACQQKELKPLYCSLIMILEKYAERGDIKNAENIFNRLRQAGYTSRMGSYEVLLKAYVNARTPAYGFRERIMADKLTPNKRVSSLLQQVDLFKKDVLSALLE